MLDGAERHAKCFDLLRSPRSMRSGSGIRIERTCWRRAAKNPSTFALWHGKQESGCLAPGGFPESGTVLHFGELAVQTSVCDRQPCAAGDD